LQEILITHMHFDHYGGIPGVLARWGRDIPVAKLPNPTDFWSTIDAVKARGLTPYLEHEDGTPRFTPRSGFIEVPPEVVLVWPDAEAEAGEVLSWDPGQRTKLELIRDYSFVKRSHWYEMQLENVWNYRRLSHGDVVHTEGATLVALHTPGHAVDHCSFWLQEDKCLFSGDHVLGWGTTFLVDLYDYMKTLEFMIALRPVHLYPGHGPMIVDGVGLLQRYHAHRKQREDQIEDILNISTIPLSCDDIVGIIYTHTSQKRKWMAQENVTKVLRKFDRAGIAKAFHRNQDGHLVPYEFPQWIKSFRRLPAGLVWLHRVQMKTSEHKILEHIAARL